MNRTGRGWSRWLVAAALCLAVGLPLAGCGRPKTKLESSQAVSLWAQLRTACSAEDPDRLQTAAEAIKQAHADGDITDRERDLFAGVLELGEQQEWLRALKLCQQIHVLNL